MPNAVVAASESEKATVAQAFDEIRADREAYMLAYSLHWWDEEGLESFEALLRGEDVNLRGVAAIAEWAEFSLKNRMHAYALAYFGRSTDSGGDEDTRRVALATVTRAGHVQSFDAWRWLREEARYVEGWRAAGVNDVLAWLSFVHRNTQAFAEANVK